ncbi:unnamed protein product [Ilex paraguariensis]|uniref:Uncharacterized protein n=1 Tax=Ilex paraguariensis TaxID=185542 RepID=A0ABC8TYC6_9AQUA
MASATAYASSCYCAVFSPQCLPRLSPSRSRRKITATFNFSTNYQSSFNSFKYTHVPSLPFFPTTSSSYLSSARIGLTAVASSSTKNSNTNPANKKNDSEKKREEKEVEEEEEVEEELPWIQEKAMDLVEFSGSVTQAIPGPRVGQSSLPWILVIPLAYVGISFVIAFVKTVRKFNSPKEKRRKLESQSATPRHFIGVLNPCIICD